jgi:hypothetical protein
MNKNLKAGLITVGVLIAFAGYFLGLVHACKNYPRHAYVAYIVLAALIIVSAIFSFVKDTLK